MAKIISDEQLKKIILLVNDIPENHHIKNEIYKVMWELKGVDEHK